MVTGAWQGARGAGRGRVREVRASTATGSRSRHSARMQYYGQLNDIEIVSPHDGDGGGASTSTTLIDAFEQAYSKVYARSARSPELGYLITQAIVHGSVEVEKPALPELDEVAGTPPVRATRRSGGATATPRPISRLEEIRAGHTVEGPGDRRVGGDHLRDPARPHGPARRQPDLPPLGRR